MWRCVTVPTDTWGNSVRGKKMIINDSYFTNSSLDALRATLALPTAEDSSRSAEPVSVTDTPQLVIRTMGPVRTVRRTPEGSSATSVERDFTETQAPLSAVSLVSVRPGPPPPTKCPIPVSL